MSCTIRQECPVYKVGVKKAGEGQGDGNTGIPLGVVIAVKFLLWGIANVQINHHSAPVISFSPTWFRLSFTHSVPLSKNKKIKERD